MKFYAVIEMKPSIHIDILLEKVWAAPLGDDLLSRKVDVSIYDELSAQIPDKSILIEEIFPKDKLDAIWDNYEIYLKEYEILPFLGSLGEATICIGYGEENKGKIFYFDFDFDFGCFFLDDSLEYFVSKLTD